MDWIHRHPYLTGVLVLAAIVLFFIFRGRSSSSSVSAGAPAGPSDALQAAQLQAGVQTQQIQAAQSAQAYQISAAIAAKQLDAATATALAKIQSDTALQALTINGRNATDVATLNAQGATAAAQYQFQTAQAQVGGQVQVESIAAGAGVDIAGIQAQIEAMKSADALAASKDLNATQLSISKIAADVTNTQTAAGVTVADINAKTAYAINSTNNQTTRIVSNNQTTVQKLAITTAGSVAKANTAAQLAAVNAQTSASEATQSGVLDLLKAGKLGNTNRAAVASLLLNPSGTGASAIEGGQAATSGARYNFFGNLVKAAFGSGAGAYIP